MKRVWRVLVVVALAGFLAFLFAPVFPVGGRYSSATFSYHWSAVVSPSYHFFGCGAIYDRFDVAAEGSHSTTYGPVWADWRCGQPIFTS